MQNLKGKRGITLIALVITIIVLLILAGISIMMLTGENSILNRAGEAKENTEKVSEKEQVQLAVTAALTDATIKNKNEIEEEQLNTELGKYFSGATVTDKGTYFEYVGEKDTYYIDKNGTIANDEPTPKIAGSTPFKPTGAEFTETDWTKGITITDANENEWTWIVVPNDGTGPDYSAVETATDKDKAIEEALRAYADTVEKRPNNLSDTYKSGKGISEEQYNKKKSRMLQSIKEYGGFYIGKYETGYELLGETTVRKSQWDSSETTVYKPVIKKDAYPYNYVTNAEAERLAENLSNGLATTEDEKGSLLFGIQWDLVLKYLEKNSDLEVPDLTSDSSKWGNYSNNKSSDNTALTITSAKAQKTTASPYNEFTEITGKKDNITALLTTGASDTASRLNVYDIAGNLSEFTLETDSYYRAPCVTRGGNFGNSGSGNTARRFTSTGKEDGYSDFGFRVSLY